VADAHQVTVAVAAPTSATTGAEKPATLLRAAMPPDITSGSTKDAGRTRGGNMLEILFERAMTAGYTKCRQIRRPPLRRVSAALPGKEVYQGDR
jgi:hypothetical protein